MVPWLFASSIFCEILDTKISEYSFILKSSPGLGIGVFATQEIHEGTTIVFFDENYQHRRMHKNDIPSEFLKYCVAESDDIWICPQRFDQMEIAWYLNHSKSPNIKRIKSGMCVVATPIKKGEEITINYNDFDEPEHLIEQYYYCE